MKHGDEAYRIFRELLREQRRFVAAVELFDEKCKENNQLIEKSDWYQREHKWLLEYYNDNKNEKTRLFNENVELKKENEAFKARNAKLEQALEKRTMENVLGTHRLVNGTQYGEWASFINGHSKSLEDALYRVVHQLLCHVKKFGMPDELDWVVKAEKDAPEVYGPLGYRPDIIRPDNDASVGWKAYYKNGPARPAGQ